MNFHFISAGSEGFPVFSPLSRLYFQSSFLLKPFILSQSHNNPFTIYNV